jgi:hypothetical protein
MINPDKAIIVLLFSLILFFALFQFVQAVNKGLGEVADINVICSDANGNLTQCNVISPCSQVCYTSGFSGSCSCQFTCSIPGTYEACGQARDALGIIDEDCLDVVICNSPPDKPDTVSEENWNYCGIKGTAVPTFEWTYSDPDGDPQQAYEIRINDSSYEDGFPPEPGPEEFTGSGGASTSFAPVPSEWSAWMNWSTNYWWIVRVQDDRGAWSEWSDQNPFRTPDHAFPWVDFSPSPQNPVADEVVEFIQNQSGIAETLCYDGGEHLCEVDPSVTYEWDLSYNSGDGFIADSFNKGNTTTSYAVVEPIEIRLRVTDNTILGSDKSCTDSETINVEFPLPEYEEVPPTVFFKKALTNLFEFFEGFVLLSSQEG